MTHSAHSFSTYRKLRSLPFIHIHISKKTVLEGEFLPMFDASINKYVDLVWTPPLSSFFVRPCSCTSCSSTKLSIKYSTWLSLSRYVEEAASVGQEGIRKHYEQAKEILKTSDEIFYHQAKELSLIFIDFSLLLFIILIQIHIENKIEEISIKVKNSNEF